MSGRFFFAILLLSQMGAALGGCGVNRQTKRLAQLLPSSSPASQQPALPMATLLKERFTAHPETPLEVVMILPEGPRATEATPALGDVARRLATVWAKAGPDCVIHVLAPMMLVQGDPLVRSHVASLTLSEASALSLKEERRRLESYVDLSSTSRLEVLVVGEDEILAADLDGFTETTQTRLEERHEGFTLAETPLIHETFAVHVDGRSVEGTQFHVDPDTKLLRFHPAFGLSQGARIEVAYYYALPRKS